MENDSMIHIFNIYNENFAWKQIGNIIEKCNRTGLIFPMVDQQISFDFFMNKFNIDKQ